jgi:L-alanine-DL-glutamate epimerase-like enolase superfamily enzyme
LQEACIIEEQQMKITDIGWTPVYLPYKEPEPASYGSRIGQLNLVVEVKTDEGLTGVGETYTASGAWLDAVTGALAAARKLLIGQDPCNIEHLTRLYYRAGNWRTMPRMGNMAFSGVEMACWDILGRSLGQPLHRLFGGALHESIGFFGYLRRKPVQALADDARRLVGEGYRVLYLKVGLNSREDIEAVEAVRDAAGPDVALRVDANGAWDVGTAVRKIKEMERFNLDFVEQPVSADDWQALGQVRARVDVPIAANEGIWTPQDLTQVIRQQAADVVVMGTQWVGGLWALKKMASMAEMAGMRFCRHCVESAIGTSAALGVMATMSNLMDGNQTYLTHFVEELVHNPPPVQRGRSPVPQGPGIGVDLDRDKVEKQRYKPEIHGRLITYYTVSGGPEEESARSGAGGER